jgi:hypothetical protein
MTPERSISVTQGHTHQFFHDGKAWKARIGVPKRGEWVLHKDLHIPARAKCDFEPFDRCIILFDPVKEMLE